MLGQPFPLWSIPRIFPALLRYFPLLLQLCMARHGCIFCYIIHAHNQQHSTATPASCSTYMHEHRRDTCIRHGDKGGCNISLVTLLMRNIFDAIGVSQVLFLPRPTWFCKLLFQLELDYIMCYWLVYIARWNWSRSTASAPKPERGIRTSVGISKRNVLLVKTGHEGMLGMKYRKCKMRSEWFWVILFAWRNHGDSEDENERLSYISTIWLD